MNNEPIIFILDAGGTGFKFSAVQDWHEIIEPFTIPSAAPTLEEVLQKLITGFHECETRCGAKASAISFCFPGPADYPNGVFPSRLTNFPCFEGGVALGDYLKEQFGLPVFINNDADLFTYGEALAGALPMLNEKIRNAGGVKEYHNLIGFILGTGFGIGITSHNQMFMGDNCCSEIYCSPSKWGQDLIAEEGISLRAVLRYYRELAKDEKAAQYTDSYDIYRIADCELAGDQEAAKKAFARFGEAAGYSIAYAACMLDGILVLGGGVSKAAKFYISALLSELRATMHTLGGQTLARVPSYIYDLENPEEFEQFVKGQTKEIEVFGTGKRVRIDTQKRLGITLSQLGTSRATTIGAYCFALHALDNA
jgi:predicted NBD/HSP70 family sugar kinase